MKKLISTLIIIFVVSVCTVELAATNNSTTNGDKTNGVSKTSSNDNVTADDTNSNSTSGSTKLLKDSSLYVLPLLNSTKIDELKKDDKITVISVNGDWAYIYLEKNAGWVFADNVESIKNNKNESQTGNNTNSTGTNTNESVNNVSNSNSTNTANTISSSNSVNGADDTNSTNNSNTSTNSNATNSDSNKSNTANSSSNSNKSNTSTSSNVKYPATMYVNVDAAYIRSSASADSGKVTSVGKNCPVTVVSKDGDWYKVEVSDGKGYMKASLLSIDKQ